MMLFNTNDTYIGHSLDTYGEWSYEEITLLRPYIAGGIVLDVGANIGTHTLSFAATSRLVVAIEPQYVLFQTLIANLALNCIENVIPHFGACGSANGNTTIYSPDYTSPENFGGISTGTVGNTVSLTTIDSIVHGLNIHPTVLKIDVEGSELDVLAGARQTINAYHPILYVENDKQGQQEQVIRQLHELGYNYQWHRPHLYNPNNFYGNHTNVFGNLLSENMLCMPVGEKK